VLLGLTAFCGFGFLASYEFGFPNVLHFLYCFVGVVAMLAAGVLVFPAFKLLRTGIADPDRTNYQGLYRLAALFRLFSVIAFMTGHFVHLLLLSF
jgi:hypothetical protein